MTTGSITTLTATYLDDVSAGQMSWNTQATDGATAYSTDGASSEPAQNTALVTSQDYIKALKDLGYEFRQNEMNDTVEVNGQPMNDALRSKIRTQLRDQGYPHVNIAEDAWIAEAYDHSYHPVKTYFGELRWDEQPRIDKFASYFKDAHHQDDDPCPVLRIYFKRWLIGAVAKALNNEQNMMLVLDGPQGIGKSYLGRWLAKPFLGKDLYIESPIHPDDKDHYLRLISKVIWEVSELGSTTKRQDVDALKAFITTQHVTVRAPYGRYDMQKPALASHIGTVNNLNGFLTDGSGNRRFMVCTLESIDWAYAEEIDVDQLWAEAVHLYRQGESWQLTEAEQRMQSSINRRYEVDTGLMDWILEHFVITNEDADFVSTAAIALKLQEQGYKCYNTSILQKEIGSTLAKEGLKQGQRRIEDSRLRGYYGIKHRSVTPVTGV